MTDEYEAREIIRNLDLTAEISGALTAIRTILNSTKTALHYWDWNSKVVIKRAKYAWIDGKHCTIEPEIKIPCPELQEMHDELEHIVERLDRWSKDKVRKIH